MMVDLRDRIDIPAFRARGVCGIVLVGLAVASVSPVWAGTVPDDVVPNRSPKPQLGGDPWPGFRPDNWARAGSFPLGPVADPARWQERTSAPADSQDSLSRALVPPAVRAPDRNIGETPEFQARWTESLAYARHGSSLELLEALAGARPSTRQAVEALRRLTFAAWVAEGSRSKADSLFFRVSWRDDGLTASRLVVWRSLEAADPSSVLRSAESMDRDPGIRAARAWARWFADAVTPDLPAEKDVERGYPGDDRGAAAVLGHLAAARSAIARLDRERARSFLVAASDVPESWREVRDQLLVAAEEVGSKRQRGPEADQLMEAGRHMASGNDAEAFRGLSEWLGQWPNSSFRSYGYFMRAQINLRAGDPDAAALDLRGASRGPDPERAAWLPLLEAFVDAGRGRFDQARAALDRMLVGPLGARFEPELLFDRHALELASGDVVAAEGTRLLLEEAYPDFSWEGVSGEKRRAPHAVVLSLPEGSGPTIAAPVDGPWGSVLFGDGFLRETAAALPERFGVEPEPAATPEVIWASAEPVAKESWWGGVFALGVGARATGFAEAGLAGRVAGLGARLRLEGVRTQEPGVLPLSRRGSIEAGLSGDPGNWVWSVVAERTGRRESASESSRGIDGTTEDGTAFFPEGPVAADWWGGRADVRRAEAAPSGIQRAQFAWVNGELAARSHDRWRTTQQWISLDATRPAGSGRFEGRFSLARLDQSQPSAESVDVFYPDLRLIRHFPAGFYLGGRAAFYRKQGLLAPVAGVERPLPGGFEVWLATDPSLEPTPFREAFVAGGDWNVPDFELPAQRRSLDLRGGLRWETETLALTAGGEWFRAGAFRTWREDDGLWIEDAVEHAVGTRLQATGRVGGIRGLGLTVEGARQWISSDGEPVPFVATHSARARLSYRVSSWHVGASVLGVRGRHDVQDREYGSFLRWDGELSYRGRGRVEYSVRIENLGNSADRRWPGLPAYGRGIFGGVRYLLGS